MSATVDTKSLRKADVTGIVLAGGRASRMGGSDKGLICFSGKPLVGYVIRQMSEQCAAVVVSANRNFEQYGSFGWPVVKDEEENFPGPLAGIAAAMKKVETPWAAVAPCDSPFIPEDYVSRLYEAVCKSPRAKAAAVRVSDKPQPIFMLIAKELGASAEKALASGMSKVRFWLESEGVIWVDFPHPENFRNFNAPQDLQQAKEKISAQAVDI